MSANLSSSNYRICRFVVCLQFKFLVHQLRDITVALTLTHVQKLVNHIACFVLKTTNKGLFAALKTTSVLIYRRRLSKM